MCGENSTSRGRIVPSQGSSPRVRGKQPRRPGHRTPVGLIPACAGKTPWRVGAHLLPPAHPRVCGENAGRGTQSSSTAGSSPRVRGKRAVLDGGLQDGGLIPACAGKTTTGVSNDDGSQAHPRVCGENSTTWIDSATSAGSSPRVRGKPCSGRVGQGLGRLIPACAGKTVRRSQCRGPHGAHPRVCGENLDPSLTGRWVGGSSPRVRGKHNRIQELLERLRLIPACAGKTRLAGTT